MSTLWLLLALIVACAPSDRQVRAAEKDARSALLTLVRDLPEDGTIASDAAVLLIRSSTPESVADLMGALSRLPEPLLFRPVHALGQAGLLAFADSLEALYTRSETVLFKIEVAQALVNLGRNSHADWLIHTLQTDSLAYHRARAAAALGEAGVERARTDLLNALQEDADPFVRASAAAALGRVSPDSAATKIYRAMKQSPEVSVAMAVVEGLERMGGPAAAAHLDSIVMQRTWSELLRNRALEALDRLGRRGVGEYLKQVASGDNPPADQVFALTGMGILRDTTATPLLRSAFAARRDGPFELASAWSLARMGAASDLGDRVAINLAHRDPGYRAKAVEVLGLIGDDRWTEVLAEKLSTDPVPSVRGAAVDALAAIGTQAAVRALESSCRAADRIDEKAEIVSAIGRADGEASGPALDRILTESEYLDVRLAAIEGLGAAGDLRYLSRLRGLLSDESPQIRFQASAAVLRLTRGIWPESVQ